MTYIERLHYGRRCVVIGSRRAQHQNKSWGFYNVSLVRYLDAAGCIIDSVSIPAGKFNAESAPTGKTLTYWGNSYHESCP